MKLLWQKWLAPRSASEWFAHVRSAGFDKQADETWTRWMAADAAHERAYESRELAWGLTADLGNRPAISTLLADVDGLLKGVRGRSSPPRPRGLRLSWQTAVAASILVVGVLSVFLLSRQSVHESEYATAIGEQRIVTLEDHSTVTLNTATRLRVLYSRAARRIELEQGEALFNVSKDPSRPFEVHALQGVTTAVGTQFDVQVSDSAAAVSVLEGTVLVGANEAVNSAERVSVSAGQGVDYAQGGKVSALRPSDTTRIRAWQAQRIVFSNVTLDAALRDYNRYLKVPIVLGSPELGERHINGVFRIGDEDAFLGALEQGLHLKVSKTDSQTILQPR